MKKHITISFYFIILPLIVLAQSPQAFKYQAVVRDGATGEILQNQQVGIRISIHDVTAGGNIVYQETFTETTSSFGLVNLNIGKGTPTVGSFTGIDWGSNSKFLEIEIDQTGGVSYISMGTSELLSVPYALYSENTVNGDNLGNHTATQNIDLNSHFISGNGGVDIDESFSDGVVVKKAGNPSSQVSGPGANGFEVQGAESSGLYVGYALSGVTVNEAGFYGVTVGEAGIDGYRLIKAGNPSLQQISTEKNGFEVAGAEGFGLFVGHADKDGVNINSSGENGISVNNSGMDGLNIQNPIDDGLQINNPGDNGIAIHDANNAGVYIDTPAGHGISIGNAGNRGVNIVNPGGDGVYVYNAYDGIEVVDPYHTGMRVNGGQWGIIIEDSENDGILINNTGDIGIDINYPDGIGIAISDGDYDGIYIENIAFDGIRMNNIGDEGININNSNLGISVTNSVTDGIRIDGANDDGIDIVNAGERGIEIWNSGESGFYTANSPYGLWSDAFETGALVYSHDPYNEWGLYTGNKIYSIGFVGPSQSTYAMNSGNSILEPGDIVCIAGGCEPDILGGDGFPVPKLNKATKDNSHAVFGVVEYKVTIKEKKFETPEGKTPKIWKSFKHANGNVKPGDYFSVIVFGQTEVKVNSSEPLKAGDALVAGNNGARKVKTTEINGITVAENTGTLGKALEDSDGKDKIKVFVNCK
ncbi:MAG: right-handed parallel beta-helix repeat-containing protein [Bacteroidales bacterium]|nr:right-handed parallel beta-helix repeat-containing protein [Bacteroidales bacterium]